jgi:hypothetical protein
LAALAGVLAVAARPAGAGAARTTAAPFAADAFAAGLAAALPVDLGADLPAAWARGEVWSGVERLGMRDLRKKKERAARDVRAAPH